MCDKTEAEQPRMQLDDMPLRVLNAEQWRDRALMAEAQLREVAKFVQRGVEASLPPIRITMPFDQMPEAPRIALENANQEIARLRTLLAEHGITDGA